MTAAVRFARDTWRAVVRTTTSRALGLVLDVAFPTTPRRSTT